MFPFKSSRSDGRSNADVIFDLAFGKEPGTTFTKEEMVAALDCGSDCEHPPTILSGIVAKVNKRLLEKTRRTLRAVAGIGYRVAKANEHSEIAHKHKKSGDRKYRKALHTINHTNTKELTDEEKKRYEATVTILNHHDHQLTGLNRRVSDLEDTIRRFRNGGKADEA